MTDVVSTDPPMSADDFLTWAEGREGRWELIGGTPWRAMAGATARHDDIVVNIISALRTRLRGTPCRPRSADQAVRIPKGNVRRPDVLIDCGRGDGRALAAITPAAVFEVQSPSTTSIDYSLKLDEYRSIASLRHIVYIDPDRARAAHWSRTDADAPWTVQDLIGLDNALDLSAVGAELPLSAIYEDVDLDAQA